ncbi:hypothetical protein BBBOND_0102840 [Babesia bigemina]|uniref:Uncharacterized protein n=1 Tax=Babesia bigemina TaxID=5866 RepID=A0A061D8A3_BABBI|nr:hypothetical protein BBBOND_0102840 [Babesia bigemina]CDR93960.1 hypothetical protein BBBOND_0102840 [Babesia bigemina]|eukprot:XP_012766146.1 hypothetical protein BBBOND_0102840 [Babesia bigemina]
MRKANLGSEIEQNQGNLPSHVNHGNVRHAIHELQHAEVKVAHQNIAADIHEEPGVVVDENHHQHERRRQPPQGEENVAKAFQPRGPHEPLTWRQFRKLSVLHYVVRLELENVADKGTSEPEWSIRLVRFSVALCGRALVDRSRFACFQFCLSLCLLRILLLLAVIVKPKRRIGVSENLHRFTKQQ